MKFEPPKPSSGLPKLESAEFEPWFPLSSGRVSSQHYLQTMIITKFCSPRPQPPRLFSSDQSRASRHRILTGLTDFVRQARMRFELCKGHIDRWIWSWSNRRLLALERKWSLVGDGGATAGTILNWNGKLRSQTKRRNTDWLAKWMLSDRWLPDGPIDWWRCAAFRRWRNSPEGAASARLHAHPCSRAAVWACLPPSER